MHFTAMETVGMRDRAQDDLIAGANERTTQHGRYRFRSVVTMFCDHGQSYIRSFVIRILQSAGLNPLFSHVSTSLSMYLRRLMYALAPQRLTLCARPSAQLQVQQKHERFII